jgi:heat shock protein HslJ
MLLTVAALLAVTWSIAGCGSSSKSASPSLDVVGHSYTSTSVTGHTMAPGTKVTLRFGTDGKLSAGAGCNTLSGNYLIQNGQLVAGQLAMTEMACIPASRQAQDAWLAGVLDARPQLVQTGTALTVTAGTTTIDLAES